MGQRVERDWHSENLERLLARVSVGAGGLFWVTAAFAGPYVFDNTSLHASARTAMWPLLATVVILVVGWFHEELAAILLSAASAAVLVWGVIYSWEPGVWAVMAVVLMGPMMIAAVLFLLASRSEAQHSPDPDRRSSRMASGRSGSTAAPHSRTEPQPDAR